MPRSSLRWAILYGRVGHFAHIVHRFIAHPNTLHHTPVSGGVKILTTDYPLMRKFPFLENLPGEPSDFLVLKVELKEVLVTDNTIGFNHTESVTY